MAVGENCTSSVSTSRQVLYIHVHRDPVIQDFEVGGE